MTSFLVLISSSKPDYLLACPANSGTATYTTWANLPGSSDAVRWAKEWVKQAVSGVYSATKTQIVDASWTDKGQFLHVKVIPMNSLICNVSFVSPPLFVAGTVGMRIRDYLTLEDFTPCYVTKGSTVYATDGGLNSVTATATSSSLTLDFSVPPWRVNP